MPLLLVYVKEVVFLRFAIPTYVLAGLGTRYNAM